MLQNGESGPVDVGSIPTNFQFFLTTTYERNKKLGKKKKLAKKNKKSKKEKKLYILINDSLVLLSTVNSKGTEPDKLFWNASLEKH